MRVAGWSVGPGSVACLRGLVGELQGASLPPNQLHPKLFGSHLEDAALSRGLATPLAASGILVESLYLLCQILEFGRHLVVVRSALFNALLQIGGDLFVGLWSGRDGSAPRLRHTKGKGAQWHSAPRHPRFAWLWFLSVPAAASAVRARAASGWRTSEHLILPP